MITKTSFGTTTDGKRVDAYTLENSSGMSVQLITYGATINSIFVPDKNGEAADVLVGFDDLDGNEKLSNYQGQTVGRYANRIAGGKFSIDGVEYNVEKNEKGSTCLHGGGELSHAVWNAIIIDDNAVEMSYSSPDGSFGFPGNADFTVTFLLANDNSLKITYRAVSDKKTIFNLTNHAYFNLGGCASGDILGHILKINASRFTVTDELSIPTGELRAVEGTPFDFRELKAIGRDIGADDDQLKMCDGYDHNFCLEDDDSGLAAEVYEPVSGRVLTVYTDLCGVQLYTGNFLDGTNNGKQGAPIIKHAGLCLETQFYPDTPNNPAFPQCTFEAGKEFKSETVFKFSIK